MPGLRNSWRPFAPLLLACWASPAPAPAAIMPAVVYEWVDVGNPGNSADITTFGAVAYPYRIGKYEVTVADYAQFLNAVATTDTYGLWNNSMQASSSCAGITRSGNSESYVYAAMTATSGSAPFSGSGVPPFRTATGVDSSRFPIAFVSYFNAARFANWMANGQPSGPQNGTTTEDGAYFVNGARSSGQAPARNSVNPNTGIAPTFFLPTENEWYKAAYYEPALNAGRGGYYRFATRNNVAPGNAVPGSLNSTQQPDSNQANYIFGTSYVYCVTQFSAIVPAQPYLVPVGTWVQTFSPCGAFDMNGNLWELCAPSTAASVNIKIRGGAWTSLDTYLDRSFYNGSVAFSTASNVGFRLAAPAPYTQSVSPLPGLRQLNKVSTSVVVILADGEVAAIEDSTIDFKVDGLAVTDKKREGKTITLTYTPTGIQFPGESHTATLTFKTAGGFSRTETWGFKNLKNVILPTPLVTENFDSAPEGGQPAGWVPTNFTADCDVGVDFTDQKSSVYMNWAVTTVGNMGALDDAGLDQVNATETVNGQPLTIDMLRSGSVLYAESDSRCNGDGRATVIDGSAPGPYGQTQFVVTKAFDLSAIKDPVFSFCSGYMQNQDSYGGVEYSVDGGATFLPIVYFLDEPDILVAPDGTTDGVATLTTKQPGETSVWVVNGVVKGEAWGDAAAAPINADIGNYIVPRINDNGAEGKRVEIFRLPAASKKSDVRLRFSATGSDSGYFWVDNLAFYDIPSAVVPTVTVVSSTTLGGAYTTDASAVSTGPTSFSVPISGAAKYFRLDGAASIKTVSIEGANLLLTY